MGEFWSVVSVSAELICVKYVVEAFFVLYGVYIVYRYDEYILERIFAML